MRRAVACGFAAALIAMAAVSLLATVSSASESTFSKISTASGLSVSGFDNIYGAGLTVPPDPGGSSGGTLPLRVPIPSGATWISVSDVTGSVGFQGGESNGPDGYVGGMGNMEAYGSISGIVNATSWLFLGGVFVDANAPSSAPPTTLTFTGDESFATLSPVLDQQFFIGDGLTGTGTGEEQYFRVPTGATDLYLGFADSYTFDNPPGNYGDNSGSLTLNVNFVNGEPASPSSTNLKAGSLIGGLNMSGYCEAVTSSATLLAKGGITGANFAYNNWECAGPSVILSMQKVCDWEYPADANNMTAKATSSDDAYSWGCYVVSATKATNAPHSAPSIATNTSVAPIASSLSTPRQVFHSMGHNLTNAIITVIVILFITFPSIVFNQTFSANYAEILLIIAGYRRRVRRAFGMKDVPEKEAPLSTPVTASEAEAHAEGRTSRPWFYGVLLAGAILGGFLNPKFGLNSRSVTDIGATLVAFAFGALVSWFIAKTFRERHHYPTHTYLHALPLGLAVALVCVLVSRLTNFAPGYLYGVVVSIAFVETLEERHNAHLTTISTMSTLGVALVSWFLWLPVNHFALEHGGNIPLAILDDVLASIFVGGLVGTVVGLLPLEFMPGGTIAKWRKDVWAVVFFVAVFLLVEVELRPAAGPTHPGGAPIATAVILFVLFGGGSFWMRYYFAQRAAAKTSASAVTPSVSVTTDEPTEGSDA